MLSILLAVLASMSGPDSFLRAQGLCDGSGTDSIGGGGASAVGLPARSLRLSIEGGAREQLDSAALSVGGWQPTFGGGGPGILPPLGNPGLNPILPVPVVPVPQLRPAPPPVQQPGSGSTRPGHGGQTPERPRPPRPPGPDQPGPAHPQTPTEPQRVGPSDGPPRVDPITAPAPGRGELVEVWPGFSYRTFATVSGENTAWTQAQRNWERVQAADWLDPIESQQLAARWQDLSASQRELLSSAQGMDGNTRAFDFENRARVIRQTRERIERDSAAISAEFSLLKIRCEGRPLTPSEASECRREDSEVRFASDAPSAIPRHL